MKWSNSRSMNSNRQIATRCKSQSAFRKIIPLFQKPQPRHPIVSIRISHFRQSLNTELFLYHVQFALGSILKRYLLSIQKSISFLGETIEVRFSFVRSWLLNLLQWTYAANQFILWYTVSKQCEFPYLVHPSSQFLVLSIHKWRLHLVKQILDRF